MTACASTSANILLGGNSGFLARWVSDRGVWRVWQNFSGSARRIGALDGAGVVVDLAYRSGSGWRSRSSARSFKSTVFCGFQRVAGWVVAWLPSHGRMESTDFRAFRVPCRLTVSYPPSQAAQIGMGGMLALAQLGSAGGRPPFDRAGHLHPHGACAGQTFEKTAGRRHCALPSRCDVSRVREVQKLQMGSGVRDARGREKSAEKCGFSGAKNVDQTGVRGKVAGHMPSDVAVAPMLCGAVNRVN
jgi:hypothetical protein